MARAEGRATPIDPGLVTRVAQGLRYIVSGVGPATWFGPSQPLPPQAPADVKGREFDYPVGFNIQTRPRAYEPLGFPELRALADGWDLLRLVIETRKDQLAALEWNIRPRSASSGRPAAVSGHEAEIAAVTAFLESPDREHDWAQWLRALLEDLFVIDAPTLYKRRDRAGRLYALELMDGATIKPIIDASGRRPSPPDPAYQQVLKGIPAVDYTADELIYAPRNVRAHKVYGHSPVEQIVLTVNIALRRQVHQLNYYTDGNVPDAIIGVPASWTTEEIRQFQAYWDALMEGDVAARRHARFVPGEVAKNIHETRQPPLKDQYDEWLARIVAFAFSIPPTPFIAQVNRATAESAHDQALEEGLAPLQKWAKRLIDHIIAIDLGFPALEFAWADQREQDPKGAAEIETGYVRAGIKSINEARAGLGLDPVAGGERPMVATGQGYQPIGSGVGGDGTAAGDSGGSDGSDTGPRMNGRLAATAAADGLAKYNPNVEEEPRDYHGRWASANAEIGPEGYGPPVGTGESGPRFKTSSQVDRDRELHPWKTRPNPEFRSYVAEQEQSTTHSPGTDGYGEIGRDDKGQPVAFGRYQLRRGALQDIGWLDEHGNWTPEAHKHGINGLDEFLTNREAQEEAFDLYLGRTQYALKHREIDLRTRGDEEFVSLWTLADRSITYTGIAGEPIMVTQSGLVAAAHREGDSNVQKYFRFLDSHHWHVTDADYEQLGSTGTIFRIIETRLRTSQHVPYDPVPDVPPPSRTKR